MQEELKYFQHNHNQKKQQQKTRKILDDVLTQRSVILVISETAVNTARVGNFFLEEKNGAFCAKKLLIASEYRKICLQLESVNCN